jgi:uncharacterized Zn-binding protein involved in type VI secretion
MPPAARVGDPTSHGPPLMPGPGSPNVFIGGRPAWRVAADTFTCPLTDPKPHVGGVVSAGSTGVFINNLPAARLGDPIAEIPPNTIVGGCLTVLIGETGAGAPAPPPPSPPTEPRLQNPRWGQPGSIVDARWEKNKVRIGDEVKLIANVKDFEDGTPVKFFVWERKGLEDTFMAEIDGKIRGNKGEATWKHSVEKRETKLKEEVEEPEEEPEYYFVVNVEEEVKRSGVLLFTYLLNIYLEDENENPLDDVEYTITFSDGSKRTGKFKGGRATIEDAPHGRFIVEVEGYNFIIE